MNDKENKTKNETGYRELLNSIVYIGLKTGL